MRDLPYARLDFSKVRAYAAECANRTSLRKLAGEIGIGHSTLANYLDGAVPHPRIRGIIGAWYVRVTGDEGDPSIPLDTRTGAAMRAGLEAVVRAFPAEDRPRVRRRAACVLVRECEASGLKVPGWLAEEAGLEEGQEREEGSS